MAEFDLKQKYNPCRRTYNNRTLNWDAKEIVDFYGIDQDESGLGYERAFINGMCAVLNDPHVNDFFGDCMKVRIAFDRIPGLQKNLVCRFDELPCCEIRRKKCMVVLFELMEDNHVRHWVEKAIFNRTTFVVIARSSFH
jgi:hypothetical protein